MFIERYNLYTQKKQRFFNVIKNVTNECLSKQQGLVI